MNHDVYFLFNMNISVYSRSRCESTLKIIILDRIWQFPPQDSAMGYLISNIFTALHFFLIIVYVNSITAGICNWQ